MLPKLLLISSLLMVCTQAGIKDHFKIGKQSYRVKGRLLCGNQPAVEVKVKLIDVDSGARVDDVMDSGRTNSQGHFDLLGDTIELTTIDPRLKVYHDCEDGMKICQRRWNFELPDKYISSGSKQNHKKLMDIGTWNLQTVLPDEEHDCIH